MSLKFFPAIFNYIYNLDSLVWSLTLLILVLMALFSKILDFGFVFCILPKLYSLFDKTSVSGIVVS